MLHIPLGQYVKPVATLSFALLKMIKERRFLAVRLNFTKFAPLIDISI